jgi:long-chain acyl-CoA synthetase
MVATSSTVDGIFAERAGSAADAIHLVFTDGGSSTYGETFQRANRLAAILIQAGIQPGDRVACLLGNSRALYEFLIACGLAGVIAVPMNTLSTARETKALFADCAPKGIVAQSSLRAALPDAMFTDDVSVRLLSVNDGGAADGAWQEYEYALRQAPQGPPAPRSRPEAPAMIVYSSGTTGAPKGIVLGHRQLLENARLVIKALGYRGSDRFLAILPSYHMFGYSFDFLYSAMVGGSLVVLPAFDAGTAVDLIEAQRITVLTGVPLMFVKMFDPALVKGRDISSVRLIDVGGGPVPTSLVRQLKEQFGIETVESYGLSEICPVACVQRPHQPSPEGSCGIVLEGFEVRVRDRQGKEVTAGEPGELQFRCSTFMNGYWNQPELTAATLKDGWLRTGDVGRVDADGNIFIIDRIKDMIVSNGYNVFPKEVELVLFAHPAVQAAAVIGVPHEVHGEDVVAFVVPAAGARANPEEIIAYCRENLARFKVPREIVITESLPLTASGKIRRFALREQAAAKR